MIQNLRPRVLNKSATPSVIKSAEMLDAVNIVADGLAVSESNTIKKAPGNIKAYLNDTSVENDILGYGSGTTSETVIGSLVDEENERVFYFVTNDSESAGSVYLLQQFSEEEVSITLLLRSTKLDFSKDDFVAADILKIPVQEKELTNEGGNFDGIQDDDEGTLDFDDSVDPSDIVGELQVTSCPEDFVQVINPLDNADGTTVQVNLQVTNVGGATAFNNLVTVGEGGGPQDAADHSRINIFLNDTGEPQVELFELEPEVTTTFPIFIEFEDGVTAGEYQFYASVTDAGQNPVQGSPCVFNVTVEVLEQGVPLFRITADAYGPGAASFAQGDIIAAIGNGGVIEEGSLALAGIRLGIYQVNSLYTDGVVYPQVEVGLSLGELQQYFEFLEDDSDTVGSTLVTGGISSTFPAVTGGQFETSAAFYNLRLKTDVAHDETSSLQIIFDQEVAMTSLTAVIEDTDSVIPVTVEHEVVEVVEINPADIVSFTPFDNTAVLTANIESDDELNGSNASSSIVVQNIGDLPGNYILNLSTTPVIPEEEVVSFLNAVEYRVNNGPYQTLYSASSDSQGYLPLGFDVSARVIQIDAGEAHNIDFRYSNEGSDFATEPLTVFDPNNTGQSVYIGENSYLGYPGNSGSMAIELRQLNDDAADAPNVSSVQSSSLKASGGMTIQCTDQDLLGPISIINRNTFVSTSGLSVGNPNMPNLANEYAGYDTSPQSFFMPDNAFTTVTFGDWNSATLSSLLGSSGSVNITDGANDQIVFDIANTTLDSSAPYVTFTVHVNTLFGLPQPLMGHWSAGQVQHDPNPLVGVAGPTGSIGYTVQYTDPIPLDSYSAGIVPSEFKNVNASSGSVYPGAVGSDHPDFGRFRGASFVIPPYSYVRVAIVPLLSSNAIDVLNNVPASDPNGTGLTDYGIGTRVLFTASGGTSTTFTAGQNVVATIRHPFNETQRQNLLNFTAGSPAPKSTPPPPIPTETGEDTSSRVVIKPPQEPGSVTVVPTKKPRKAQSSGLKTPKKRRYGK